MLTAFEKIFKAFFFELFHEVIRHTAAAVQHCVEGSYNHVWPISALQIHPAGIMVCDDQAATEIKVATYRYFKEAEKDNLI